MKKSLRLRLVFKNDDILSETQKSEGLKKSWVFLQTRKQQLQTIAAVSDYIAQAFHLQQSCPHGLLLSMDGFILPPFESTTILKDRDIITVKKKGGILAIANGASDRVNGMQIAENRPVNTGALLLANEEFAKESGGHLNEESDDDSEKEKGNNLEDTEHLEDGNAVSNKRKASEKLQGSKKKKQRSEPIENIADEVHSKHIRKSNQNGVSLQKRNIAQKEEVSKHGNLNNTETNAKSAETSSRNVESTPSLKRNEQVQNDGQDADATPASQSTRKTPSRSARRKYAKRRWLQEMAKIQKKHVDSQAKEVQNWKQKQVKAGNDEGVGQPKGLLHWKQSGQNDVSRTSRQLKENRYAQQKSRQIGVRAHEVLPTMTRPGHIRFKPLEEDDAEQQSQITLETCQWNGLTNKKKGQQWGIGKSSISQGNDYVFNNGSVSEANAMQIEKQIHAGEQLDFDKLPPLPTVPQKGDVIAYRLLELSSSWTPEISSYRVGKVSYFNYRSFKIFLMPVPEYPLAFQKSDEEGSNQLPDNTLYNGDGSLEIDFRSLVDIREIKGGVLDPTTLKATTNKPNEGPICNETGVISMTPCSNDKQKITIVQEGGAHDHGKPERPPGRENGVNLWEQLSEAINAKKAELSQENSWGKSSSGRSSYSNRAFKGGTPGAAMAYPRSGRKR